MRGRGTGSAITRSVLLGADWYEDGRKPETPLLGIGRDVVLDRVIVDKNARIGDGARLVNEKGVDPNVASGIVGNAWHEGAGFQTSVLGDGGDSFGEFQFNKKGELPAFQAWAQANKRNVNDWKSQYDFVLDRLNGPYKNVLEAMRKAGNPGASADAFMRGYERPSIPHLGRRQGFAAQAFDMFGKGRAATTATETNDNLLGPVSQPEAAPRAVPLPPKRPKDALPAAKETPVEPEAPPAAPPATAPAALPTMTLQPLPRTSSNDTEPANEQTAQAEPDADQALPMDDTQYAAAGGMIEPSHDEALGADAIVPTVAAAAQAVCRP